MLIADFCPSVILVTVLIAKSISIRVHHFYEVTPWVVVIFFNKKALRQ